MEGTHPGKYAENHEEWPECAEDQIVMELECMVDKDQFLKAVDGVLGLVCDRILGNING